MNDKLDRFVRPLFFDAAPYDATHHDFAWQQEHLARMMSNECPLGPSGVVLDAMMRACELGQLYPHSGQDLRQALARFNDVPTERIVLGAGSTEVLDVLVRLLVEPADNTVIATPTYAYFASQTRINGGSPRTVPLRDGFALDVDGLLGAVDERTKCIMLCSPNNPTGKGWDRSDLVQLLDTGVPVMVDQAYLECGFADDHLCSLHHSRHNRLADAGTRAVRVGHHKGHHDTEDVVDSLLAGRLAGHQRRRHDPLVVFAGSSVLILVAVAVVAGRFRHYQIAAGRSGLLRRSVRHHPPPMLGGSQLTFFFID